MWMLWLKKSSHEVEGWDQMVKRARKILFERNEIGKRMEVVGEEGIALEDIVILT